MTRHVAKAQKIWATTYLAAFRAGNLLNRANAVVPAGLRWAPDTGAQMVMARMIPTAYEMPILRKARSKWIRLAEASWNEPEPTSNAA